MFNAALMPISSSRKCCWFLRLHFFDVNVLEPRKKDEDDEGLLLWDPIGLGTSESIVTDLLYHKTGVKTSGAISRGCPMSAPSRAIWFHWFQLFQDVTVSCLMVTLSVPLIL